MTTPDLATATTMQLLMALERREVSTVELLDGMLANIERMNPAVNAVVAMDMERARAEASAADNSRAAGDPCGPLHGLPMTIKDCYETLDLVTVAGAPELSAHVPTRDADVVRLLRRAGAIVWAKTNVHISPVTTRPTTRCTASPTTRGISLARPADRQVVRRLLLPADSARRKSAATSATRSVNRPGSTGFSDSRRPTGWSRVAATFLDHRAR